jgi:hypothetical protein
MNLSVIVQLATDLEQLIEETMLAMCLQKS